MNQAVVCIAPNVAEAEKEVNHLRAVGFKNDDISVLWPDVAGAQELGYEQHTRAPAGIAWGVTAGGILGGIQAYLAVNGIITCPWSNDLINAGPVISTLSGIAVGGMLGYLLGWSIGSAFPLYEAMKY
ncbi:MAG: hypothetical protein KGS72_23055, partial [Cyanobacteria bacterium REEB67]|nr:hypothetical protein [Cyanobacteria bacterium REEB67]